jgi:predicted PP-loop superfamily ATPase
MVATLLERMPVGEGRAEQERIARGSAAVAYSGGADTVGPVCILPFIS